MIGPPGSGEPGDMETFDYDDAAGFCTKTKWPAPNWGWPSENQLRRESLKEATGREEVANAARTSMCDQGHVTDGQPKSCRDFRIVCADQP